MLETFAADGCTRAPLCHAVLLLAVQCQRDVVEGIGVGGVVRRERTRWTRTNLRTPAVIAATLAR